MKKHKFDSQDKVAETLLFPLSIRAREAREPNPMVRDEQAIRLVENIDYDFSHFRLSPMDHVTSIMRVREFDRHTTDFLSRASQPVVVHIGCGLDTRFARVDDGRVEWYDLDLPEVITLRKTLIPDVERCQCLGYSVFDTTWLDIVQFRSEKRYLFLAEGVFPYFTTQQVRQLFLLFLARFPGCELVCDGMSPWILRMHNLQLKISRLQARLQWGLKNGREPETWGPAIRLLSEWFYFDQPEPRLGAYMGMRLLPFVARSVGIYHYQLGSSAP